MARMKHSTVADSPKRADRSVAWWSALLLAALVGVLMALFLSARLLLSRADAHTSYSWGWLPRELKVMHMLLECDVDTEPFGTVLVAAVRIVLG
jgi:hypothetical protein